MDTGEENEEVRAESNPVEPLFSRRPRLPILLLWAFLPATFLTLAGLCLEFEIHGPHGILVIAGLVGGPVILLVWSFRILWPMELKKVDKVMMSIFLTIIACLVNFMLAVGACDLIDPPYPH